MNIEIETPSYIDVPFDEDNFSALSGTFTANDTDFVCSYKVLNKTLFWELNVLGTTSSTPEVILCKLPNSYTIKNSLNMLVNVFDGVNDTVQNLLLVSGEEYIEIRKLDTNSFSNTSGFKISFSITIEIQ